jgi:DNA-binding response OmpR family regulator
MEERRILIVDDDTNIRLTLSLALEPLGLEVATAMSGREALEKVGEREFALILLDLKMPGMDGMEVLRQIRKIRPDIPVIILTAYGTIETAVDATRLGAADFIRKPFGPAEIRGVVSGVLDRAKSEGQRVVDYASCVTLAREGIKDRHFDAAMEHVRRALSLDPGRPEAFNLLGVLLEIRGERVSAQQNYRTALSLDPHYEPANRNLHRSTSRGRRGAMDLGDMEEQGKGEESGDADHAPTFK